MTSKDNRAVVGGIMILLMIGGLLIMLFFILNRNLGTDDSSALYGGQIETRFPYSGYVMINRGASFLCGINYISPRVGVTAAHCVKDSIAVYPNVGQYSSSFASTSLGGTSHIFPGFTNADTVGTAGIDDLAVITLNNDAPISEFATVATPSVSCNYYITAYGRNEAGLNFERRGGRVCINRVLEKRIELDRTSGFAFFCGGDSGAGIYELDTNKLVGIVSAYYPSGECTSATTFYATRVDAKLDFINQFFSSNPTPTPSSGPTNVTPTSTNQCPTSKDVQFWIRCPGAEFSGCGGLDGWIAGSSIVLINPVIPFNLDVNCFANSGQSFTNARVELYRNGNLITSSTSSSISDYQITQSGSYSAKCIDKTIPNCEETDNFVLGQSGPTATPTLIPSQTPSPTVLTSITPTASPTQIATVTISPSPTQQVIATVTRIPTTIPSTNIINSTPVPTVLVNPILPDTSIENNQKFLIIAGMLLILVGIIIRVETSIKSK